MEYAKAEIRIAGSNDNTVIREVSAAEVPLLRSIHGPAVFAKIEKSRSDAVGSIEERDRLSKLYAEDLLEKLFPGALGKLPLTLAEVGVEQPVVEAPAKKAK